MTSLPGKHRKQRCAMTTDSDREMITGRARRASITNSRFIIERMLETSERQPIPIPRPRQIRSPEFSLFLH